MFDGRYFWVFSFSRSLCTSLLKSFYLNEKWKGIWGSNTDSHRPEISLWKEFLRAFFILLLFSWIVCSFFKKLFCPFYRQRVLRKSLSHLWYFCSCLNVLYVTLLSSFSSMMGSAQSKMRCTYWGSWREWWLIWIWETDKRGWYFFPQHDSHDVMCGL